jgi:hypothetical protein
MADSVIFESAGFSEADGYGFQLVQDEITKEVSVVAYNQGGHDATVVVLADILRAAKDCGIEVIP